MQTRTWALTVLTTLALATPAAGQTPLERLDVHGFLTQGFAGSTDVQLFGVPTDATLSYRSAALQLRYRFTTSDHVVLQLDHRRLGGSPLTEDARWVGVDWAFYQRFLGTWNVRMGRVPLPQGIYNEIRDVGTLLPFYRAPANFYMEGFEAIDGGVVGYRRPLGAWFLEASLFGGTFDFKEVRTYPGGSELGVQRRKKALGSQLWLETPVPGLRLGVGAMRWDVDREEGGEAAEYSWRAALDGKFDRLLARAEYRAMRHVGHSMASYYGQLGLRLTEAVVLNAQADLEDRKMTMAMGMGDPQEIEFRYARDFAIGVNYRFSPELVFKLEGHRAKGYNLDRSFSPLGDAGRTDYAIASMSIAF
jgi:hypothetical protein